MLRILHQKARDEGSGDEELLEQYVSGGSSQHLGQLYERYMSMVYGVCLNILKDRQLAEDAVIGIYETMAEKVKTHRVESFRPWLYVLARNYCLMEWRKQKRKPTNYQAPEVMERFDAVDELVEFEFPQEALPLQPCLEQLQALQRQCVEMFYLQEKSYKDIADLLQQELGKVRSFIQNGKRNLRLCLEKGKI